MMSRDLVQIPEAPAKRSVTVSARHAISASSARLEPFRSHETQPRRSAVIWSGFCIAPGRWVFLR